MLQEIIRFNITSLLEARCTLVVDRSQITNRGEGTAGGGDGLIREPTTCDRGVFRLCCYFMSPSHSDDCYCVRWTGLYC